MRFKLLIDEHAEESVTVVANKRSSLTDEIENAVMRYSGGNEICVYNDSEFKMLSLDDVECISVLGGKCEVIDKNGSAYLVRERLYEIERGLPQYFIRINKSAIANEKAIQCFKSDFGGGVSVIFKCGYSDYVSRRCFAEIKRRFKKK